jgi:cytosine/adenosine deaminase-related metal-dependent hydrolase
VGKVLLGKYLLLPPGGHYVRGPGPEKENRVKEDWGVVINNERIEEVGENSRLELKYSSYEILDFRDKIIAPGFVNAHMHSYGVLSHGITAPEGIDSFDSFLNDFWWPLVENRIDHRMIEITSRAAAWELLNSGVTTFCDVLEAPNSIPGALEVEAKALEESGIRAVLSFEACERISPENGAAGLEENRAFYLAHRNHPRISGKMCIHTTFTCSRNFITRAGQMAREIGSGIQLHLSESVYEPRICMDTHGILPVELYEELGFWSPDVLASQGVQLKDRELDILKSHKVNLVHVPLSNCEVGGGIAPVPAMLKKGINVALGTDGYINNFFEVMRGAFLIHKANEQNPEIMAAETVFNMATINGGRALNREIGFLAAGAAADLITINTDLPTPVNKNNIFDQLLLYRNPEHVGEVFVGGKMVKAQGLLIGVDLQGIREETRQEAAGLWEKIE